MLTFSASRAAASGHIGGGMVTVSEWTLQQRRERTQGDEKTRTLRAARALLNKFTTSNFEDCYKQLIELHYQEGHTVRELVKMIFDMATTQILFQKVSSPLCITLGFPVLWDCSGETGVTGLSGSRGGPARAGRADVSLGFLPGARGSEAASWGADKEAASEGDQKGAMVLEEQKGF